MRNFLLRIMAAMAVVMTSISAHAQSHYDSRVSVGGHAGYDLSRVFFSPSVRQGFKSGCMAGMMLRYVEENHFGLIAEVNFVQRGWKEDFRELTIFDYSRTINYVEIPVMTHIYFGRRGHFFFNAGPQIAFCLGESTSANFNYNDIGAVSGFPVTDRRNDQMTMPVKNKIDYGISAGLGGEFFINPRNSITIEARAYYGLGNIFSARRSDTFGASNQLTISLTAGYWFRFK